MSNRAGGAMIGFALLASLAVGCGDDDDDGDTATTEATTGGTETTLGAVITTAPTTTAPTTTAEPIETAGPIETTEPAETTGAVETTADDNGEATGGEFVIESFQFPDGFEVPAGEEFTITNADSVTHTVTSDEFDVTVDGGASTTLTIDEAGTYDIICQIHPSMTGTITAT